MSKNIVDSILELNTESLGIIATRRQIDYNSGYVNNWNTKTFYEYVKKNPNIIISRDHGGPNQGNINDDGKFSFIEDCKYFDIIHIDPWKVYNENFLDGIKHTIELIKLCLSHNPKIKFEILTEQSIVKFEPDNLDFFLKYCKENLTPYEFENIEYVVIQSGVGLDLINKKNIGTYNESRLKNMINVVKSYGKKTKEHNGDYLTIDELKMRFELGLDSINIGPELVQYETELYLKNMSTYEIDEFYRICLNSKNWVRWVPKDFDVNNKEKLIQTCAHYSYNSYELPEIDIEIKNIIKHKLKTYLNV